MVVCGTGTEAIQERTPVLPTSGTGTGAPHAKKKKDPHLAHI
jgi:hypothetical protein